MRKALFFILLPSLTLFSDCTKPDPSSETRIIFLHHSTGQHIWDGKKDNLISKSVSKISYSIGKIVENKAQIPKLIGKHNRRTGDKLLIKEINFPKESPYGWNNFPYDYYHIWVNHAGFEHFLEEPTLEILTKEYNIVMFKHCFPVSNIQRDTSAADPNQSYKSLGNYKAQYLSLRDKLLEFPETKFIVWTGAAQVKSLISEEEALKAKEFFTWVTNEWDQPNDNIFIWDFYSLQVNEGIYFPDSSALSESDSHPGVEFATYSGALLVNRIIDIANNNGVNTSKNGKAYK
jgi:hypothetical protein